MSTTFKRQVENFVCEHCGETVVGDGYTNHCPNCLWSKHVDINPGDRSSPCKGQMEPIRIEIKKKERIITHQCQTCGYQKKNKTAPNDNFNTIIEIVNASAKRSV